MSRRLTARNWRHALATRRTQTGMSLRALGAALGVSFSTLARIERGAGQPDRHRQTVLTQWLDGTAPACGCHRCQRTQAVLAIQCPACQAIMEMSATVLTPRKGTP